MWWLWGSIAAVLAVVFIGAFFHDRRHKGSTFGGDLESARHAQNAANDRHTWGGGIGGGGGF